MAALDGKTMGTTWSVRYAGGADPARLRAGIEARLATVISQMSGWEAESDISRFNRAPAGSWHVLPDAFCAVLDCALATAEASGGAFDPTIGPIVDLWGFGPSPSDLEGPPTADSLATANARVGWQRMRTEEGQALQPGGLGLDLNGIAKGYAVDLLAEYLRDAGIASSLVEIGGELRGHGVKPDGMPWWVTLESVPGSTEASFVVALHDLAVATSGDYRRFFEHAGQRYAHTLDPRTGMPVAGIASVTVLHASCMQADAWATALAVMGLQVGMEQAAHRGIAALFVTREAAGLREHLSPAFTALLD